VIGVENIKRYVIDNSKDTPVYQEVGYIFHQLEEWNDYVNTPDHSKMVYSRFENATTLSLEHELAKKEKAEWAVVTPSGMAAIDLALSSFQKCENNNWMFLGQLYSGTYSYIKKVLESRRGIHVTIINPDHSGNYNLEEIELASRKNKPDVLFFETMSNPLLIIPNMREIINWAKGVGCYVVTDNTLATPYLLNPLEYGADLVVHSATKYLSGHNNLLAGLVVGKCPLLYKSLTELRKYTGVVISPFDANRLHIQQKSFELRFIKQCRNAVILNQLLIKHGKVKKVFFPANEYIADSLNTSFYQANELFKHSLYGAVLTFELDGKGYEDRKRACSHFITEISHVIPLSPSLGSVESSIMHLSSFMSGQFGEDEVGYLRISMGIEDIDMLLETIDKALSRL
jgi:cystathionine beta-lyase/cystathionine gamma-synthase